MRGGGARPLAALLGAGIVAALMLAGCGGSVAQHHNDYASRTATYIVHRGDTLYGIARHFGVSVSELMRTNGIADARDLHIGRALVIPGANQKTAIGHFENLPAPPREPPPAHPFAWPVYGGVVSSVFGIRRGVMHDGIDIAARKGTAIHAADSGTVVYSGWLRGYGNVVIIQHSDHYVTVYGHDSVNLVRAGQRVERGQIIARLGSTGRTTGPNLHFEVRHDNLAYNPLGFLPGGEPPSAITFARGGGS
ncbi:MAG: peptidoglycan DD-metalloendopeptidase family protein [Candidatus Binataceae bacterium]